MRRILFILPSLIAGGAEKITINILNSLVDRFQVNLLVLTSSEDFLNLVDDRVKVIILNERSTLSSFWRVKAIFEQEQPDIVFSSLNRSSLLTILIQALFNLEFKIVIRLPTLISNKLGRGIQGTLMRSLEKKMFKKADLLITQTDKMRREAVELYNISSEKVITVPNIVDKDAIRKSAIQFNDLFDRTFFNIVASGRLHPVKGFDILIEALNKIRCEIPNVKLHILGKETQEVGHKAKLDAIVKQYDLADLVVFHGFVSNPYPFYKNADLFVLSSRKEGFPNVILECLVLKTPVVATDCVDFTGIIEEHVNGVVVQKENVDALANGIIIAKRLLGAEIKELTRDEFDYGKLFTSLLAK